MGSCVVDYRCAISIGVFSDRAGIFLFDMISCLFHLFNLEAANLSYISTFLLHSKKAAYVKYLVYSLI